jgi:hypothetical protein
MSNQGSAPDRLWQPDKSRMGPPRSCRRPIVGSLPGRCTLLTRNIWPGRDSRPGNLVQGKGNLTSPQQENSTFFSRHYPQFCIERCSWYCRKITARFNQSRKIYSSFLSLPVSPSLPFKPPASRRGSSAGSTNSPAHSLHRYTWAPARSSPMYVQLVDWRLHRGQTSGGDMVVSYAPYARHRQRHTEARRHLAQLLHC